MELIKIISVFLGDIGIIVAFLAPIYKKLKKQKKNLDCVGEGIKCLLRTQMMNTYYRHLDDKTIREYAFENFLKNYEAYKALNGNSFADKIYEEVKTWKIVS